MSCGQLESVQERIWSTCYWEFNYPCGIRWCFFAIPYPCGVITCTSSISYPCGVRWCSKWGISYPCGIRWCSATISYPCGIRWCTLNIPYPCGFNYCAGRIPYPCRITVGTKKKCYDFSLVHENCKTVFSLNYGCCDGKEYRWTGKCLGWFDAYHRNKKVCFDDEPEEIGDCTEGNSIPPGGNLPPGPDIPS